MLVQAQVFFLDAQVHVPVVAVINPVLVPLFVLARLDEELHFHLLELAGTEDEVARGDLVAEGLADVRDAKRRLHARGGHHVLEVNEDALCGFRTQVVQALLIVHRAQEGLEQTGEGLRFGPVTRLAGFWVIDICQAVFWLVAVLFLVGLNKVVGTVALAGVAGFHQRVRKDLDVTGGYPDLTRLDDGGIYAHDVCAGLHHVAPPLALDVFLELYTKRAVVPRGAGTAVNFTCLVDQAAALTQVYNGIDDGCHKFSDSSGRGQS